MRYAGQSSELGVSAPPGATVAEVVEAFEREHERTYGHTSPGEVAVLVTLRFRARRTGGRASYRRLVEMVRRGRSPGRGGGSERVYFAGRHWDTPVVVVRADLAAEPASGPLVVREYDSTIVVPPGFSAALDDLDNVIIEREA
jgi:N-methylhydantoinase A